MNTILHAALRYLSAGVAPIPIWRDEKKNPRLTSYKEYTTKLPTEADVRRWFTTMHNANIGLITGYWQLCGLDFDDHESFNMWSDQMWNKTCPTWIVSTGRGFHVWFRVTGEIGPSANYTRNGCDVLARCKGGYCIAPPSIHHTGTKYETAVNAPPMEIDDITDVLPGWRPKAARVATPAARPIVTPIGQTIRIEELIPIPQGAKPNRRGAYKVHCPFHDDKTPSAWLNPKQQRFGCNHERCLGPDFWWDTANVYAMLHNIGNDEAYRIVMGVQRENV